MAKEMKSLKSPSPIKRHVNPRGSIKVLKQLRIVRLQNGHAYGRAAKQSPVRPAPSSHEFSLMHQSPALGENLTAPHQRTRVGSNPRWPPGNPRLAKDIIILETKAPQTPEGP
ncbi:unnamed protein product [Danaus chrysippus]|uniref:(African queen) hypothetical protein n=1 Tax=Danaus chrysippus TaxID=151541 RepID=A0A8J2VQ28_9NEOP|nr:unnamed protein product [Danaus chrysippus]